MNSRQKLLGWWEERGAELMIPARRTHGHSVVGGTGDGDETDEVDVKLLFSDFIVSILWVWSTLLVKVLAHDVFGGGELLRWAFYLLNLFLFAWLGSVTGGGAHHPLVVLASSLSESGLAGFRPAVLLRIVAQFVGYAIGVGQVSRTFPDVAKAPELKVGTHRAALTEGVLSFLLVIAYLGLKEASPTAPVKIFITSIFRSTLRSLGGNLTGGIMNPAMAFGWALARGNYLPKELVYVYSLVPFEATVLAVWTFLKVSKSKLKKRD